MHDNGLPYQPMTAEQYSEAHADLMAVAQSRYLVPRYMLPHMLLQV